MNHIMNHFSKTAITILLFLIPAGGFARPVSLPDNSRQVTITPELEYFEDRGGEATINDITAHEIEWQKSGQNKLKFGYTDSTYWFRFTSREDKRELYLEIDNPSLDLIEVYREDGAGGFTVSRAGDSIPFREREIRSAIPVFKIGSGAGEIYLKIDTEDRLMFSARLLSGETAFQTGVSALHWSYYGLMLVMLLFNLMILVYTGTRSYLYISGIITGWLLMQFSYDGYAFRFLWPELEFLNNGVFPFSIALVGIASALFIQSFIGTKRDFPIVHRILDVNIGIYSVFIVLVLTGVPGVIIYLLYFVIYVVLANFSFSLFFFFRGNRQARFLLAAFTINFIANIVGSLEVISILDTDTAPFITKFSTSIMIFLLTIGLADELNQARKKLQVSEERIRRKNLELQSANEELSATNEEFEAQNEELIRAYGELEEQEKRVKDSLEEKEILLKEIHHRVKNNMQIISSLLSLQEKKIHDKRDIELFRDSQGRIRTMAMIHEMLYQSTDFAHVSMDSYVRSLVDMIREQTGVVGENIEFVIDIHDISLGIDRAIPCALMINELVTNAMKHAFPDGTNGTITISMDSDRDSCVISVADNGIGMARPPDMSGSETLGFILVTALAKQLKGTVEVDIDRGTRFTVSF